MPVGAAISTLFFFLVGVLQLRRTIPLWRGSPDSYYIRMYDTTRPVPPFWPWPLTERLWRMFPKYEPVTPIGAFAVCLLEIVLALHLSRLVGAVLSVGLLAIVGCCIFVLPWTISYWGAPRSLIPPPLRDR